MSLPTPSFSQPAEGFGSVASFRCYDKMRPGTAALAAMLRSISDYDVGGWRECDATGVRESQHKTGRAIDFHVNYRDTAERAEGQAFLNWLMANRGERLRRLGVVEIIWAGKIWTTANDQSNISPNVGSWRMYTIAQCPNNNDTACHYDHFHLTLSAAGSEKRTTWWTSQATEPEGPHTMFLKNANTTEGSVAYHYEFGKATDAVVFGDWDNNGSETPGMFRDGVFYLKNSNTGGSSNDLKVAFGRGGDIPIAGDWNGDGRDEIGVRRGNVFHLTTSLAAAPGATKVFRYGDESDRALMGDWNGDRIDTPVVIRDNLWMFSNDHAGREASRTRFGSAQDQFVAGDWNGDGKDTIGAYRGVRWYLTDTFSDNQVKTADYGASTDLAVTGDWNGDGRDTIGVARQNG